MSDKIEVAVDNYYPQCAPGKYFSHAFQKCMNDTSDGAMNKFVSAVAGGAERESHTVQKDAVERISPQFTSCVGKVLAFGEKKYPSKPEDGGRANWQRGLSFVGTVSSLLRHSLAILRGEDNDKETGLPHICHVGANAMFMHWYSIVRPDKYAAKFDDRAFREND